MSHSTYLTEGELLIPYRWIGSMQICVARMFQESGIFFVVSEHSTIALFDPDMSLGSSSPSWGLDSGRVFMLLTLPMERLIMEGKL